MRLTLIALLLAGVVGCDPTPEELALELDATLKAAEQGDAEAQFNLGLMYDDGKGVPHDNTESVKWFRKAAEQGYAKAQHRLGFAYLIGQGVPKNDVEGVKWYRKAAEQGYALALRSLGSVYDLGRGVPQNKVEAYALFSVAATNGDGYAKNRLPKAKAELAPEQLVAAEKRIEELTEEINANKAK